MQFMPPERRFKQLLVFLNDSILITLSLYLSYALRFATLSLGGYTKQFYVTLPLVLAIRLALFYYYGLYRGMWRYSGVHDLLTIIKATTVGSLLIASILFMAGVMGNYPRSLFAMGNYPRSIFVISWFIVLVLIGGSRFAYRLYRESWFQLGNNNKSCSGENVLIVGAGKAGEAILREIINNYCSTYNPVGLVDDDRSKRNMTIHGYKVLGNTREIPKIIKALLVNKIFVAMPSADPKTKRRILMTCQRTGLKTKVLPGVGELLNGKVKIEALRNFQIEDLLGRKPVKLDTASIQDYLNDKTVMITGAGGSIGSELCRRVARFSARALVLFEQSQYNLYQIQMNLRELFPDVDVHAVIGSVTIPHNVERCMARYMPEVIFHAAAYKHVPLMEMNPAEALRNNVLGTRTVAEMAKKFGVGKFVMVSTDKAVRSTNIMGVSKRIAELVCQSCNGNGKTQFVTVRFGNVLNSVGRVVPLIKQQIEKGGQLTVTHPEVYRYFMTIPEAVQLILQAGAMGQGGEIFILEMGEPIRIVDLARDMITLSGLVPDRDIKIVFTGLRPGEKLYEELFTEGEEIKSTLHEKIKVAGREEVDGEALRAKLDALFLDMQQKGYTHELVSKIKEIVPEFQPENGGPSSLKKPLRAVSYELSCKLPGKQ